MRRRFLRKASLLVYSCEDTDDSEHPSSSSSLYVQRSVAHVQNLSDVVDATCFHRVEDHVGRRPSYLDVIAADVGGKRLLPPSRFQDAVGHRSVETCGCRTHNMVCFQPCKRSLCPDDWFDSAIGKPILEFCPEVSVGFANSIFVARILLAPLPFDKFLDHI